MTAKTYLGDIIGGSIMLRESRLIAQLLLQHPDDEAWERAVVEENLLQKSSVHSAKRMASTVRKRLEAMSDTFWSDLLNAPDDLARQMLMLSVMCQSPVLIDFMATDVADARRMYREAMRSEDWPEFFASRQRVITGLERFSPSSIQKMGSNIFKILADVGYLESARSKRLKAVYLLPEIREWANRLNCPKAYEAMEAAR
ncbi:MULTISPECIES: DUF1819 family protein [Aeromonas]|uniref:DUF1819 family protein n=1 Tax=Aeromonas caviae TaxID=648 RepID=A0AAW9FBP1_AERCA|nr:MULTISPECIES: DUF1819 family protein [Aeromonas]MDX7723116.1 DUF1819 family protein [Aeromonas caviae]GJA10465.1 hypothetical protein KAM334_17760 [Aeromonas caviae]GJA32141.1 hypothetical protein KAM341_18190 [Aeromonas caviae]GJA36022.1 hypothetical protein KAM342_12650 [Aeromonas caviae]GJA39824.1 hypothetical protein KAM343_06200 [Aeromonas caviae]